MGNRPGYLIGNFTVVDPQLMAEYGQKAAPLVQRHGGAMMLSEQHLAPVEGNAQPVLVIIRFPSIEDAQAFYGSADYAPIRELRVKATTGGFLSLVPGLPDDL